MSDNPSGRHVTVWVQKFGDRPYLMLQWHDPATGKRKSKSAETCNPIDAERARAALEYELNHGLYREASRMPWERFRQLFEDEFVASRRENTRKNYRAALDQFEKLCGPKQLRSVTTRTVSAFAAALRKQPGYGGGTLLPNSVKIRLQCLRTALRWAAEQKLLPECPRFAPVKVPKKRPQPFPAESFERLLAKADGPAWRAFLLCGWLAGLRLAEALALEWEQADRAPYLDPARDRIVFPAEAVKAAEDQWVPLDPELWDALDALPRQGRKVFRFEARGKPLGYVRVSNLVRELAHGAGVKATYRTLRRGFGCRYAGKVPAQVLQKLMRHANIRVTMDYYANVDDAVMSAVLGARRNSSRNTPLHADPGRGSVSGQPDETSA